MLYDKPLNMIINLLSAAEVGTTKFKTSCLSGTGKIDRKISKWCVRGCCILGSFSPIFCSNLLAARPVIS